MPPLLNRAIIPPQIINRKRNHAEHLYALPLDRLTVSGDERAAVNFHDSCNHYLRSSLTTTHAK